MDEAPEMVPGGRGEVSDMAPRAGDRLEKESLLARDEGEIHGRSPTREAFDGLEDGWTRHDFGRRPAELVPEDPARLDLAHRRFAAAATEKLEALLRRKLRLEPRPVEIAPADALATVRVPARTYAAYAKPFDAGLLIAVRPRVLLGLIERLLGSPPGGGAIEDRALTELEDSLAKTVLRRLVDALGDVLPARGRLELETADLDRAATLLRPAPGARVARLVSAIVWADGEGTESLREGDDEIEILVPHGPLLTALTAPASGSLDRRDELGDELETDPERPLLEGISPLTVTLSAELTTEPLPLRDLLALEPGDMIDTGVSADAPLALRLDGAPLASGRAGTSRGRLAVRVEAGWPGSP